MKSNIQPGNLCPTELSFKNKGKIKAFFDNLKNRLLLEEQPNNVLQ